MVLYPNEWHRKVTWRDRRAKRLNLSLLPRKPIMALARVAPAATRRHRLHRFAHVIVVRGGSNMFGFAIRATRNG